LLSRSNSAIFWSICDYTHQILVFLLSISCCIASIGCFSCTPGASTSVAGDRSTQRLDFRLNDYDDDYALTAFSRAGRNIIATENHMAKALASAGLRTEGTLIAIGVWRSP
jgi:hypothetical protein